MVHGFAGGQQVNLLTDTNLVEDGTLGTNLIGRFTVCGWVNARSLSPGWGGNRIVNCQAWGNGPGFDLVQLGDGRLRIGINGWPDWGPAAPAPMSSPGKITADPDAGPANWVFFAVTYDPELESGNLKYYFGGPTNLASLDTAHTYTGAGRYITNAGPVTVGNANRHQFFWDRIGGGGRSRVFRGLIDEVRICNRALSLAEIQQIQLNAPVPPAPAEIITQPKSVTVFEGQPATFSVRVAGTAPITYQWQTNGVDVPGETNEHYIIGTTATNMSGILVRVLVANPFTHLSSETVTLTVLPETGLKVFTSLSESAANNPGNLRGYGLFTVRDGYPVVTTNVPIGPYAPLNNFGSVDFGIITDYMQSGGRKVQFTDFIGNDGTLGPMTAFTICGWLNCADLTRGYGGNRIAYCLDSQMRGFDLVVLPTGNLQLGVNQWPDVPQSPAVGSPVITADPEMSPANWVFFAVVYDGSLSNDNVSFYFGTGDQEVALDWTTTYDRGPVPASGTLAIGNANTSAFFHDHSGYVGAHPSFRGAIDEIRVYNKALTLEEIQTVQKAAATVPSPTLNAKLEGNQIVISWVAPPGSFRLQSRPEVHSVAWADVTVEPTVVGHTNTVMLPMPGAAQFFRLSLRSQ